MTEDGQVDGRVRRGEASKRARRAQIKEAALGVFSERGYHDTSVSDVVAAAGVARGTFYLYFDGKEAIFLELLDDLFAHLESNIVGVTTSPGSPPLDEQLHNTVVRILHTVVTNRPLTRIIFREAVGLHDRIDERVRAFDDGLHNYVSRHLQEGAQAGLVGPDVDPVVSAACVIGSLREVVNRLVVSSDADFDLDQVARGMIAHHLHGMQRLA